MPVTKAGAKWPPETVYVGPGVTGEINVRQTAATSREGTLTFSVSRDFLAAMPKEQILRPKYDFSFYIHGNRTTDNDCQHQGFVFKVKAVYLE